MTGPARTAFLCIRNVWITMPDGVRLAARLWLPTEAPAEGVPAIFEYVPYRKSDGTSARDQRVHPWFAAHGYAALRVDLRGSGDSEGLLFDEYTDQEHRDALAILAWTAAQPWCNGRIGMMGLSWGGFNALQVAALQPRELQAIVTVGSTDDRYADDVHYMGGCQLSANLTWSQTFFADLSRPPDPAVVGDAWRRMWHERVDAAQFFAAEWARHPTRDAFWRHGSICEDYGRIRCPVLAVGGWADSYTNSVPRLITGLSGMRRGLVGPWGHDYPHLAMPGPAIDFLGEALRWWDRWLKDIDTGVERDPLLRMWLQDALPADPAHTERPGRWIGIDTWPCPDIATIDLYPGEGGLSGSAPRSLPFTHRSPLDIGAGAGEWCAYGMAADQPTDQRADDGKSLCFDTSALEADLAIVGTPKLHLDLAVDATRAMVAVRLNDVAPDGASSRVSYGLLNLNHRDGHHRDVPVVPGERFSVTVDLNIIAHVFKVGHRLRVAISTAYWPTAWPAADHATLTVFAGRSHLALPVWTAGPSSAVLPDLPPPRMPEAERRHTLQPGRFSRRLEEDLITGTSRMHVVLDFGEERIEASGMAVGRLNDETYEIKRDDPLSAKITTGWTMSLARGDWAIRTDSQAVMTTTADAYRITARLDLFENGEKTKTRTWDVTVPKHGVPDPG